MFQAGVITCLSCGKTTSAESVASLPENPYLRPEGESGGRRKSGPHGQEEFFYSDSEEDDHEEAAQAPHVENGVDPHHVKGIQGVVVNSQKSNFHKIQLLMDSTLSKLNNSKVVRQSKEKVLQEAIIASDQFRQKLDEEFKNNQNHNACLATIEAKLLNMKNQIGKLDPMDYESTKSLYDEIINIKKGLNNEVDTARHNDLQTSIRHSTVKINFDKCDELLTTLKAENDTIFMKLSSSLETDPSMIFLTTFMLGNIFSEKISTHNPNYKEMVHKSYLEDGLAAAQPLDDVSDYIGYLKDHFDSIQVSQQTQSPQAASNSSPGSASGTTSPTDEKEWKVVGNKKENKPKPMSFSEMAKKPGNPQPVYRKVPFPEKTVAQTNRPHCYFKIQIDNDSPFRVVFELRPDMAPKMVDNFIKLCQGTSDGKGYKGSKIFRAKANDHILGGDYENDDGTGGHSAYDERHFLAEQCPLKDHKGAIRMKGLERTGDGRCKIGSQFMIWVGDLEYKEYRFTLVFGKIVEGFDQLQEVSRIKAVQKSPTSWVLRQNVVVIDSGVL